MDVWEFDALFGIPSALFLGNMWYKWVLELGVPSDSANMFWSASDGNYPSTELVLDVYIRNGQSLDSDFFKIYNMNEFQVIPCWSAGRLVGW